MPSRYAAPAAGGVGVSVAGGGRRRRDRRRRRLARRRRSSGRRSWPARRRRVTESRRRQRRSPGRRRCGGRVAGRLEGEQQRQRGGGQEERDGSASWHGRSSVQRRSARGGPATPARPARRRASRARSIIETRSAQVDVALRDVGDERGEGGWAQRDPRRRPGCRAGRRRSGRWRRGRERWRRARPGRRAPRDGAPGRRARGRRGRDGSASSSARSGAIPTPPATSRTFGRVRRAPVRTPYGPSRIDAGPDRRTCCRRPPLQSPRSLTVKRRKRPFGAADRENGWARHQPSGVRRRSRKYWPGADGKPVEVAPGHVDGDDAGRLHDDVGDGESMAQRRGRAAGRPGRPGRAPRSRRRGSTQKATATGSSTKSEPTTTWWANARAMAR